MPTIEEQKYLKDVVRWEQVNSHSREKGTLAKSDTSISLGQVLGRDRKAITNFAQDSGSNLTESDVSLGPDAQKGDYEIHGTGSDEGHVVDPDGYRRESFNSLPYDGDHLRISDSGSISDGDKYTVTVGDGSGKFVALDPSAVDGGQEAHGISLDYYDTTKRDVPGVVLVRDSEVIKSGLEWPDGISPEQKSKALAELRRLGVVVREEV